MADAERQITQRVYDIYKSGTPLFTKESIRQLAEQVDKVEATGEPGLIYTTAIDGMVHEIETLTGLPNEQLDSDEEWDSDEDEEPPEPEYYTSRKAMLDYRGLNQLVFEGNWGTTSPPKSRFMSLGVANYQLPDCPAPIEQLRTRFHETKTRWDSSKKCEEFRSLVENIQLPPIKKIVAFACGTLAHPFDENAATQLSFALTLRDCHSAKQPGTFIECLAQDPGYFNEDKQVLREAGIVPVDDPDGFLEVDEDTVVFSQLPSAPIRQIIADIARPAMMIWRKVGPADVPVRLWADDSSPRVEKMVRDHYTERDFIKLEGHGTGFDIHTAIYVRNY